MVDESADRTAAAERAHVSWRAREVPREGAGVPCPPACFLCVKGSRQMSRKRAKGSHRMPRVAPSAFSCRVSAWLCGTSPGSIRFRTRTALNAYHSHEACEKIAFSAVSEGVAYGSSIAKAQNPCSGLCDRVEVVQRVMRNRAKRAILASRLATTARLAHIGFGDGRRRTVLTAPGCSPRRGRRIHRRSDGSACPPASFHCPPSAPAARRFVQVTTTPTCRTG